MVVNDAVENAIEALFTEAGYQGMLSVLDVDGPGRVELWADEQAYAASTFKIAVGLELFCQAADGELDSAEPISLSPDERTLGGQGLCLFAHPAEMSLRDLAVLMLTISDNTATDAVIRNVGPQRINARMRSLGLVRTDFARTIHEHFTDIGRALGFADLAAYNRALAAASPAEATRATDMRRAYHDVFTRHGTAPAPHTTAAEMASLLRMLWRDEAGRPAACAQLRTLLQSQRLTRKLATGFPANVAVAAKSGTVPGVISNDVGVVTYPDGHRYAVAVLTRTLNPDAAADPVPDEAAHLIGTAARTAIDHLRSTPEA